MRLEEIQNAITVEGFDGWLFYDHHRRDPLAYRILGLPNHLQSTRRWYYYIPARGEPRALCHRIESHNLDSLPGEKFLYSRWSEQKKELSRILAPARIVAMQHSSDCALPYIAMVDAGTVELICGLGIDVSSSANLVQQFEACWTATQFESHLEAGRRMDGIRAEAFQLIRERTRNKSALNEWEVRKFLLERFASNNLQTDHGPIVAVNANASDPHYEPTSERHSAVGPGDFVLIDMWAKLSTPDSVFYDITWTSFCGDSPRSDMQNVFGIVAGARDAAVGFVQRSVRDRIAIAGFQVDDAARGHIDRAGFGDYFIHRTGHSIGVEVHGAGANMDNYETHDERRLIPWTCFSVEPGIYMPDFGIRSEVNVFVSDKDACLTGQVQRELLIL
ncbi:MAG TPA: M24 family metallopeptidase [Bryobacteraceae bacterium]|nr:M24 family metallopeptidase [Bryobacteraceae bacterium]